MRKITIFTLVSVFSIILIYSVCFLLQQKNEKSSMSKLPESTQLDIKRLDSQIFACKDSIQIDSLLQEVPLLTKYFLQIETEEDKQRIIAQLYAMVQDPAIQALYKEVQEKFKDFYLIEKQLEKAFQHLKYHYPNFTPPPIYTLVTGMGTDLYVSDSLIVIGLDYFLGEGASVRPHLSNYLLHTYQPHYIVPKIILLLAEKFNISDPNDHTLLHNMLYSGKAYFFCKAILPETTAADVMGYTTLQWQDTERHQKVVWQHFVDNQLFYATDPTTKRKYLGPRPFVSEIGSGCPGRIAGWLGWQIINKYMKNHPTVTLAQLMQMNRMQEIFIQSKYKPK
jgi:gliding motility-associated lipoprotein GldB